MTQMAIDTELVLQCDREPITGVLRFYRMDPPAVTIGRHQKWRSVIDPDRCRVRGWDWVRRPTGGGALLHAREINYAVVVPLVDSGEKGSSFRRIYERIIHGPEEALKLLGCRPELHLGSRARSGHVRTAMGLCEYSLTRYEITIDGKKAVAAAQWTLAHAVLQHGTIYLHAPGPAEWFSPRRPGSPARPEVPRWWSVDRAPGLAPHSDKTFSEHLKEGFTRALDIQWKDGAFDGLDERAVAERKTTWAREQWNRLR